MFKSFKLSGSRGLATFQILTSEMLDKTTARQFIAPRRKGDASCHFDRREKSFLDPSHSLGMTGRGHVSWRLCVFARVMVFPISSSFPNFKYFWLEFMKSCLSLFLMNLQSRFVYDIGNPSQF